MKDRDWKILWPEYFKIDLSSRFRRLPKELCVSEPHCEDIAKACKKLGILHIMESEKYHPAFWWRHSGRVKIKTDMKKSETIRKIAPVLKTISLESVKAKKSHQAPIHKIKIKKSKRKRS